MSANMREHAPSARRLQKAREDGKSWRSPDLQTGASLVVGFGGLLALGPWVFTRCFTFLHQTLTTGWPTVQHGPPGGLWLGRAGLTALVAALPLPFGVMAVSVAVGFALHGFRIPGRFKWNTQALNPLAGITRMVGGAAWVDLLRRIFTIITLGLVALVVALAEGHPWLALAGVPAQALPAELAHLLWPVWFYTAGALGVWGVVDAILQARRYQQSLRMTTQELRDEMRETQGDPLWRARRRAAADQRLRKSAQSLRDAAVVVVNPTHAAVALVWTPGQDAAPTVAGKGTDETAAVIRAIAAEEGIPIISNPPLAWQLMTVPIGDPIPEDTWRAVALILAHLLKRRQAVEEAATTEC